MAAHSNRQAIIFCSYGYYLSSFFLPSFFLRLFSAVGDWMSTILPYISANSECMSEIVARGSLKIQDAKVTQKIAICAPPHNFVGL